MLSLSPVPYIKVSMNSPHHNYRRSRTLNFNLLTNSSGVIGRAKMKTVKIMGVLVLGFILCWAPYYVMSIWWWAHQKTAEKLDFRIQKLLWAFACLNNCINPLLYRMVGPYK